MSAPDSPDPAEAALRALAKALAPLIAEELGLDPELLAEAARRREEQRFAAQRAWERERYGTLLEDLGIELERSLE